MLFKLIEQNDHFILINKLSAIGFHCEDQQPGLFEQVKSCLQLEQLYPVHRLDKLTTGLILFAKTQQAASQLAELFRLRKIAKYYLAISDSKPQKKQGLVKGDMTKARRGCYKLLRTMDNPAKTRFVSCSIGDGYRLFLLKPYSGKTHQLRVALKSVGSPILGDDSYHPITKVKADRGYLHAYALQFELNGQNYSWVVKPDEGEFFQSQAVQQRLNEQWSEPWLQFKE